MTSSALAEALKLAHERLDDDSDAYADEDLLGRLVEAVEAEGLGAAPDIGSVLLEAARASASHARAASKLNHDGGGLVADSARKWADAARLLLEGYRLAPVQPLTGDDPERVEIARMVTAHREEIAGHRALLIELAQTFGSARTATADRFAARITRHLDSFGVEVPTKEANNDPWG